MAKCTDCGSATDLYSSGVPICVQCSDAREAKRKPPALSQQIREVLHEDLIRATKRNSEALREFDKVMGQFPSGLQHTDGVQGIKNASNALSIARKEMATAHNRLNDYLNSGIVPEDLKRSG